MKHKLILALLLAATCTACATRGNQYAGYVNNEMNRAGNYQFGNQASDVSGPTNRAAARSRPSLFVAREAETRP